MPPPTSLSNVSLSNLSLAVPASPTDTTPLFTALDLNFGPERTGITGRNGCGKSTLLRLIAGELRPDTGQVQRVGTAALMRQDPVTRPGDTIADLCGIRPALDLLARAESGRATAEDLANADWTLPARLDAALLRAGLSADPLTPLESLSGGQRSRASITALILAAPDILLLDEPTNNLDQDGRRAVIDLIRGWRGCAIIVSHDRELLGEMDAIVELTSLGAVRYGGNYDAFRQRKDLALQAAAHDLAHAQKTRTELARRAQQAHERKARKDATGQRARLRGDQPKILMDAAKGRAEASGGAGARLREARQHSADTAMSAAWDRIEILQPLQMQIPPTGLAKGRTVLHLDRVTGGHDPAHPIIRNLSLTVTGPERILISGPNGSGKSTLLRLVCGQITAQSGRVQRMVPFALLDQHIGQLDPALDLRANFRRLNPVADAQMAHAALARFGFRALDGLRLAGDLSGGQRLRAGLCCALGALPAPMLLVLDEPTNHLDLDGLTALENALAAYDGAVLLVSHDRDFVAKLAPDREIRLVP